MTSWGKGGEGSNTGTPCKEVSPYTTLAALQLPTTLQKLTKFMLELQNPENRTIKYSSTPKTKGLTLIVNFALFC